MKDYKKIAEEFIKENPECFDRDWKTGVRDLVGYLIRLTEQEGEEKEAPPRYGYPAYADVDWKFVENPKQQEGEEICGFTDLEKDGLCENKIPCPKHIVQYKSPKQQEGECPERKQHCWNKGSGHTCSVCCFCHKGEDKIESNYEPCIKGGYFGCACKNCEKLALDFIEHLEKSI